jgi:hypothetical protein
MSLRGTGDNFCFILLYFLCQVLIDRTGLSTPGEGEKYFARILSITCVMQTHRICVFI